MSVLDPAAQAMFGRLLAAPTAFAVKGTLIFVLAYVVTRYARSLTAERRHAFWLVVLFVLAILPAAQLISPVVRVPLLNPLPSASGTPPAPVSRPAPLTIDQTTIEQAATISHMKAPDGSTSTWVLFALAGAWVVGALGVGIRLATGHIALSRMMKSSTVSPGPEALLRELAGKVGVRSVHVFAHPRVTIPFTTGILRPTIFLPRNWHSWPRSRLEAVLFHELAHVKRRDALSNAGAQFACAVAWFNPLAWVARGMLFREAELSCDRAVLSHGVSALDYADAIIEIVRRARGVPLHSSWPRLGRRSLLRERITGILTHTPRSSNSRVRRGRILAPVICLLAPVFLLSVSFRGADRLFGMWLRPDSSVLQHYDQHAGSEIEAGYVGDPARSLDQYSWNEDGTGYVALPALPDVPARRCRFVIEEKWTDRDGYTWYHIQARWSGMPFPLYTVIRLHPSGNLYELTDSPLGYPDRFLGAPGDEKHKVYVRL
jgi:beta-lactamase regulating signal transducer with metallopeptidase domain